MGLLDRMQKREAVPARRDPYAGTYGPGKGGGYAGAAVNRLTSSLANWSGSANHDLDGNIGILRARARHLSNNDELGKRFLSLVATNVVGRNNPQLQVRAFDTPQAAPGKTAEPKLDKGGNDAIETHWVRWGRTLDITGKRKSFPAFCRLIVKAVARDGEALIRIIRNRNLPYGMALQALEADRLDDGYNATLSNGNTVRMGVELDTTGRAVAYWIKSAHPGESYGISTPKLDRVLAQDMIHLFLDEERAEQVRGVTWFHAIIIRNATFHRFQDAAVTAAEIGASKIAALEREMEAPAAGADMLGDSQGPGGVPQISVEAGEMFELPPGYKLSSWNPEYPHANFESFVKTCFYGLSAGLDVANHNLSGNMEGVNYSSARIAELGEREIWMILQDWFIAGFVRPVYEEWLSIAMLMGAVTFDGSGKALPVSKLDKFLNASRFQGRRWSWVDPQKEMEANRAGLDMRITSRTRIAAERGESLEDILDELAAEEKLLQDLKLSPIPQAAPPAPPQPEE